jgi:uroporphyrin-III C-methyltransferase/precorrin-2 dehydrogenase/sirohydrochlorin ferrochelatase
MIPARVALVGAGPGDPELITLRGARRLAEAELVLYDALVDARVLGLAPRAQRFPVGKRAGRPSMRQETIHALMIRAARRGRRVVRLKAGDPFVLGRGGEEALALLAAGVPFEVVPGLSSALAAPALAGIPLTHRGLSASFLVVSGHEQEAWRAPLLALPPESASVVVLMGLRARAQIGAALLRRGWPPETPAAILLAAGTDAARTWSGSLSELAGATERVESGGLAGVIVVGAVVGVGDVIAEREESWRRRSHTVRSAGRA